MIQQFMTHVVKSTWTFLRKRVEKMLKLGTHQVGYYYDCARELLS